MTRCRSTLVRGVLLAALMCGSWESARGQDPDRGVTPETLRVIFVTDVHTNLDRLTEVLDSVRSARPALVLEGGDLVHDGTESEFRRVHAELSHLATPWHGVRGNHDAELRGPFESPPPIPPDLRVVEIRGVAFVLLDNHTGFIADDLFVRLEEELMRRSDQTIIIVMHIPALVGRMPGAARLRRYVPFRLAEPTMRDPSQVARFAELASRAGVAAVLSGHTHFHSDVLEGGVRHVVAGAVGGLTPGLGIPNEYLELVVEGRAVRIDRVRIGPRPPRDPIRFVANAFHFYRRLNGRTHSEQGWSYIPSASLQLRGGPYLVDGAGEQSLAMFGVSFERLLGERGRRGLFGDLELAMGRSVASGGVATGLRVRPLGDFNGNLFLSAAATTSIGVHSGRPAAEVGVQVGSGLEWRSVTLEAGLRRTTGRHATTILLGRRY